MVYKSETSREVCGKIGEHIIEYAGCYSETWKMIGNSSRLNHVTSHSFHSSSSRHTHSLVPLTHHHSLLTHSSALTQPSPLHSLHQPPTHPPTRPSLPPLITTPRCWASSSLLYYNCCP
ncbi:hypothetical protein Pcinc_026278 [Petrolisthes cinctipes]|uniref:Uncharacterized protein n=1 Tax=Petrolisthes cinctipes TaxID=88211 RepID=A0AAE1F6E2_PETCI|nr:hypothetical protein Pcinc_026278 [Petrolisthes cinctipes]